MAEVGWFADLLKESLTGVGFFADYVQLHFDLNPLLNIYAPIEITSDGVTRSTGDLDFANALIGLIRRSVAKVTVAPGEAITIHFRGASLLTFSTRRDPRRGEAFTLFTEGGVFEE